MPRPNAHPQPMQITDQSLEFKRQLGRGSYGSVSLMSYRGQTPSLSVFRNRDVIVKEFFSEPDNDMVIGPYLFEQAQRNPNLQGKFCCGMVIQHEGKPKIIGDFVAFDEGPPPVSSDLETFYRKLRANDRNATSSPYFTPHHIGVTLSQLAISSKAGQDALHEQHVFHLDTGARNFMVDKTRDGTVNVRINDYGLSQFIPRNGVVYNTKFVDYSSDSRALNGHGVSIATDLYALRISMFENVALSLGVPLSSILRLGNTVDRTALARLRKDNADDNASLQVYFQNAWALAQSHPNWEVREQVSNFLFSYQAYLCVMPPESQPQYVNGIYQYPTYTPEVIDRIRLQDYSVLQRATRHFNDTNREFYPNDYNLISRLRDAEIPRPLQQRYAQSQQQQRAQPYFQQPGTHGWAQQPVRQLTALELAIQDFKKRQDNLMQCQEWLTNMQSRQPNRDQLEWLRGYAWQYLKTAEYQLNEASRLRPDLINESQVVLQKAMFNWYTADHQAKQGLFPAANQAAAQHQNEGHAIRRGNR